MKTLRRTIGPFHNETIEAIQYLVIVLYCMDLYDELEAGESWWRLKYDDRYFPPNHPDTINAIGNLASTWYYQGGYDEAEAAQKQALKHFQFTLGPSHPFTLEAMALPASIYFEQEKWEEAETGVEGYRVEQGALPEISEHD